MKHLSLFSGIGGFDLAAEWVGWQNIAQVEIDPFLQKILKKEFPETKKHLDIRAFNPQKYANAIDVISGGFPCQPFSFAGERRGKDDDRHLWPEMFRVIKTIKPKWIVAENVPGLLTIEQGLVIEQVLTDLENEGYYNYIDRKGRRRVAPFLIPACAVNASHRRDRVWIIAHANRDEYRHPDRGLNGKEKEISSLNRTENGAAWKPRRTNKDAADASRAGLERDDSKGNSQAIRRTPEHDFEQYWTQLASELCRVDDGIPKELDKNIRIKALGNAIVPQVAYQIFKAIDEQVQKQKD